VSKKKAKRKKQDEEKTSKWLIRAPLIVLAIAFVIGIYFYSNGTDQALTVKDYYKQLENKDYEAMYNLVETEMTKEEFITRIKNIYDGIEASDISVVVAANTKDKQQNDEVNAELNDKSNTTYTVSMDTIAGNIKFINTIQNQ